MVLSPAAASLLVPPHESALPNERALRESALPLRMAVPLEMTLPPGLLVVQR